MPLHSRWPLFDVSESTWLPSVSSASGEVPAVLDPEVAVEPPLEVGRLPLELVGEGRVLPDAPGQASAAHLRVVGVALDLAGRAREAGQPPVPVGDGVPGVLPALVLEAGLLVPALIPDVPVAHQVGVLVDPVQRRPRLAFELVNEACVTRPALVLVEKHDVEGRGIGGAVVRRVRPLFEGGHLAVAHLVGDAAGILVAEIVDPGSLPVSERTQRRGGELRRERERLEAREDAVAAEHGHEPRQTGGRKRLAPSRDGRREAQCREVDEAPPVRRLQRVQVAFEPGRLLEPGLQAALHVRPGPSLAARVLRPDVRSARTGGRDHVEVGCPLTAGLDMSGEGQAVLVDLRRRAGRDRGRTLKRLALVSEHQPLLLDPRGVAPLLLECVLDLEQVGEVAGGIDADGEVDGMLVVIQDRELFVEPVSDRAPADHRQLRVDVHRARTRYEEEARLEVLEVVDRERIQLLAVHGQDPPGEEAGVEREQAGRIGERRLDVAARVTDHKRVAVEDRDEIVAHAPFLRGPGNARWNASSSPRSPSRVDGSAEERRHRVLLTARDPGEDRLVGAHDAVGLGVPAGERDIALRDRDQPAHRARAGVTEIEADRAGDLLQRRFVPARREGLEELGRRIRHLCHPSCRSICLGRSHAAPSPMSPNPARTIIAMA